MNACAGGFLCLCCLFMVNAAKDCGGDRSCIADRDSATMLQSRVKLEEVDEGGAPGDVDVPAVQEESLLESEAWPATVAGKFCQSNHVKITDSTGAIDCQSRCDEAWCIGVSYSLTRYQHVCYLCRDSALAVDSHGFGFYRNPQAVCPAGCWGCYRSARTDRQGRPRAAHCLFNDKRNVGSKAAKRQDMCKKLNGQWCEATLCTDVPEPHMKERGYPCVNNKYIIAHKCNSVGSDWAGSKWCQKSCWKGGKGYEGDNCASAEANVNALHNWRKDEAERKEKEKADFDAQKAYNDMIKREQHMKMREQRMKMEAEASKKRLVKAACIDIAPPTVGGSTCAQHQSHGHCEHPAFTASGFCLKTCGACQTATTCPSSCSTCWVPSKGCVRKDVMSYSHCEKSGGVLCQASLLETVENVSEAEALPEHPGDEEELEETEANLLETGENSWDIDAMPERRNDGEASR